MQSSPKGKARVKDTASSSGSPVFVSRRDTICLKRKLSLHPCLVHTCISLCFTGFKLVFFFLHIAIYNSLSFCLSLPLPYSPSPSSPSLSCSCPHPSVSVPISMHSPPTPRQSSALNITSHKRNKNETHKPASTYTWLLKRTRVNGTCPSIWKKKTGTLQTKQ